MIALHDIAMWSLIIIVTVILTVGYLRKPRSNYDAGGAFSRYSRSRRGGLRRSLLGK